MKKRYAIITAGGSGARMKSSIAKQFLEIGGKPILLHTIELFQSLPFEVNLILVLPPAYKEYWKEYILKNDLWMRHVIADGGITRFHSVKNALNFVDEDSIVAVHDGVRPFLDKKMLIKMFEYSFTDFKGLIPVLPAVESMREIIMDEKGNPIDTVTVNRDNYLFVQTPQVFDSTVLKECYKQPYLPQFTDDASVIEKAGYKIKTITGSKINIKITTPDDLALAEFIYSSLQQNNP